MGVIGGVFLLDEPLDPDPQLHTSSSLHCFLFKDRLLAELGPAGIALLRAEGPEFLQRVSLSTDLSLRELSVER